MPLSHNRIIAPPPPRSNGYPVARDMAMCASEVHARLPFQQDVLEEQPLPKLLPYSHPKLEQAIESGDAGSVLEELANIQRMHGTDVIFTVAMKLAIDCGRLHILQTLMNNGIPVDYENLEAAARSGHIPILAHLMQHLSWHIDRISKHGHTVLTCVSNYPSHAICVLTMSSTVLLWSTMTW